MMKNQLTNVNKIYRSRKDISTRYNPAINIKYRTTGITLIALVVTVIVLIILAGVSINLVLGNNGIITKTKEVKTTYSHSAVFEKIQLEYLNYLSEKETDNKKVSLVEYFQGKNIVGNVTEDGTYVIDTVELMGSKQTYGNGTDGKTDVYVLKKDTTTNDSSNETYNVFYYGKKSTDTVSLGKITDKNSTFASTDIDWEQAKLNAAKHPSQSSTNDDIGIGTDGKPVNLDLWTYSVINDNQIGLNEDYGSGFFPGYDNSKIINGKIQGKVPQYIKPSGSDKFYPVTSMMMTFSECTSLVIAPEIPNTVTNMESTFKNCQSLTAAPIITNNVNNLRGTFSCCYELTGDLIINSVATNLEDYNYCLNAASINEGTDLKLSGTCEILSEILATKSEGSNISIKE